MSTTNGSSARVEVEERELPVKLSDSELLDRGDTMARTELLIETLQIQRAEITAKIKQATKERAKLAHIIDCGTEERKIRCHWQEDFPKNAWRLVRQDTGEEVDTRAMTADDRQDALPFESEQEFAVIGDGLRPRSRKRGARAAAGDLGSAVPPPRTPRKKAAAKTQNVNA